ncbi:hypothetical protein HDE_04154 [Halotydeus destructor]|nr:hypothetical protein HDE_04154 [Halotydeus destructor]
MDDIIMSQVRNLVQQQCDAFDFDSCELDMVQNDDQFVCTFIDHCDGLPEKSAAAILRALTYRKKHQVYKIEPCTLPMDMHGLVKMGSDIYGNRISWVPCGRYRIIPELVDSVIKMNFWEATKGEYRYAKFHVYLDMRGLSYKSLNLRLSRKMSSLTMNCFPGQVVHLFICGLPLLLTAVIQAMVNLAQSKYPMAVSFISLDEAKARVRHLDYPAKVEGSNLRDVLTQQKVSKTRIEEILKSHSETKRTILHHFDHL